MLRLWHVLCKYLWFFSVFFHRASSIISYLGSGTLMPLASGGFAFKLSCQVMNSKCRCLFRLQLMETWKLFFKLEHLWGGDWEEMVSGVCHRCLAVLGVDIWNMLTSEEGALTWFQPPKLKKNNWWWRDPLLKKEDSCYGSKSCPVVSLITLLWSNWNGVANWKSSRLFKMS